MNLEDEILKFENEVEKNYQTFRVKNIATKEDVEKNPFLKIGEEYSQYKDFNDFDSGFDLFKQVNSFNYFISLLRSFKQTFGQYNKKAFENELDEINNFIVEAEKINLKNAFSNENDRNYYHEYLRLKHGYYKKKYEEYYSENNFYPTVFFSGIAVPVYAKYFLYREWLQQNLIEKNESNSEDILIADENNFEINEERRLIYLLQNLKIDKKINQILINRIDEIKKCITVNANMAIIVLTGSILEGVLFNVANENKEKFYNTNKAPKKPNIKNIKDWSLQNLIEVAHEIKLINHSIENAVNIQQLRNYIHPHKEFSDKEKINIHFRNNSLSDLKLVLEEISRSLTDNKKDIII